MTCVYSDNFFNITLYLDFCWSRGHIRPRMKHPCNIVNDPLNTSCIFFIIIVFLLLFATHTYLEESFDLSSCLVDALLRTRGQIQEAIGIVPTMMARTATRTRMGPDTSTMGETTDFTS